ncbi:hypothetical protein A6E13_20015 [Aliivibrio fischeri]|uniref:hypothetical protein n=1 Tax=Aliivibrio fischeri TaxID=668 RepID=UPI00080EB858|nr:hypothetical protein [Aliivibrio fischeri]OCH26236.1 hypothetical protein A6E13_20015 [Aliivibrio fischeri]
MGKGLSEALIEIPNDFEHDYNGYYLAKNFYSPGYLSSLTAYLKHKATLERNFDCDPALVGYLDTIGIFNILWNRELPVRRTDGINYTPITQLCSAEATDDVTASINSCLRHFTGYIEGDVPDGLSQLSHVVGELQDNVWSHGYSTGFSMAQKSAVPQTDRSDFYLEFAIADKGLGFLEEVRRSGKAREHNLQSDEDALLWCIQEGNSTKHANDIDEWAQQLPPEHIGDSPYGGGIGSSYEVNHHQGLGLAHLVELVEKFQGKLTIASGLAILNINENGEREIKTLDSPWKGVAIACRFKLSLLCKEIDENTDNELLALMGRLRG